MCTGESNEQLEINVI